MKLRDTANIILMCYSKTKMQPCVLESGYILLDTH